MQNIVDVLFPVKGRVLPWDHSYALFGALSRVQPLIHQDHFEVGVFPINGRSLKNRRLELTNRSQLRLRVPSILIPELMCFIGTTLDMDGHQATLGNPKIEPIKCTSRLFSPWVTLKDAVDHDTFRERVLEEMERNEINGVCSLVAPKDNYAKEHGKGSRVPYIRRTRSIKGNAIVGFALLVEELAVDAAQRLMTSGLGGRRHFGGGLFLPAKGR